MSSPQNIIVLTHGWTGSSVFSALLGQGGCWLGAETVQKVDYDTHENTGLVSLNRRLIAELAPGLNHEHRFAKEDVELMQQRSEGMDLAPYRAFVEHCDRHGRWLWKDPRLTWTIRVWAKALELDKVSFLLLTRDPMQAWVSSNLRRHIQSRRFTRDYNEGVTRTNMEFVQSTRRPHVLLTFEDLLLKPERTLLQINDTFGTALTLSDLESVCDQPLRRKSRGLRDLALATMIYAKNYRERDGRARLAQPTLQADRV
jgi:hypothetical protein